MGISILKMKMNKKNLSVFIVLSSLFFVSSMFSCTSTEVIEKKELVWNDDVKLSNELVRFDEILEKDALKAVWKIKTLEKEFGKTDRIQESLEKAVEKAGENFKKSLDDENIVQALRYAFSFSAAGIKYPGASESDIERLKEKLSEKVPGLSENKSSKQALKVSTYVDGTVTVFVDKGLKIMGGMGMADAVLGSGFFISKDGYIVTNHHVISDMVDPKYEGFCRLYVKLADDPDTKIPAKVIGYDSVLDLALLKAQVDAPYVFELGSSKGLEVGDRIFAIGSPLGLEKTLTGGVVSAVDRKLFTIGNVFQIDAAVNSGNSGGPIIDNEGRVQAIVFAGVPNYQGLNFAIPVEYLRYELPLLASGGKRNHVWSGSYGRTKREPGFGTKEEGVLVNYVLPGSSASLSGLKAGDVIKKVNSFTVSSLDDLQNIFISLSEGTIVNLGTENDNFLIYLEKRPDNPGKTI